MWTTYQIIGSVAWGVNVSWPEPFKSFTSGLQALYFVAVGGECFTTSYNYYFKLLLMTLWPIVVALLIFVILFWVFSSGAADQSTSFVFASRHQPFLAAAAAYRATAIEALTCTLSDRIMPRCCMTTHASSIPSMSASTPSRSRPSTKAVFLCHACA